MGLLHEPSQPLTLRISFTSPGAQKGKLTCKMNRKFDNFLPALQMFYPSRTAGQALISMAAFRISNPHQIYYRMSRQQYWTCCDSTEYSVSTKYSGTSSKEHLTIKTTGPSFLREHTDKLTSTNYIILYYVHQGAVSLENYFLG